MTTTDPPTKPHHRALPPDLRLSYSCKLSLRRSVGEEVDRLAAAEGVRVTEYVRGIVAAHIASASTDAAGARIVELERELAQLRHDTAARVADLEGALAPFARVGSTPAVARMHGSVGVISAPTGQPNDDDGTVHVYVLTADKLHAAVVAYVI